MTPKTFGLVTGILFLLGALVHIVRLLLGVHVTIGSIVIPFWISWLRRGLLDAITVITSV